MAISDFEHPPYFNTHFDAIQWVKRSVYHIAKLSLVGNVLKVISSGTGILAQNKKMITCAHIVGGKGNSKSESRGQVDGLYVVIYRDEVGMYHYATLDLKSNETLHVYEDLDLAIITLPDRFYLAEGKYFLHPNHHAKISMKPRNLGYDVAVLGYPLQQIKVVAGNDLNYGNVCLRADKGVVNHRIQRKDNKYIYEFTIPFNPGNSGGPVFDTRTGEVFALVQSYKRHILGLEILDIKDENIISQIATNKIPHVVSARYSVAFSMNMFARPFQEHGIIA